MKVSYRQSGGFAGLILGCDLDTEKLPPAEAAELLRLVEQAALDKIGAKTSAKGRDLMNYEIVVVDKGHATKATFDDMTIPANVQALVDFLSRRASAVTLDR
jgi:hypothetical protein